MLDAAKNSRYCSSAAQGILANAKHFFNVRMVLYADVTSRHCTYDKADRGRVASWINRNQALRQRKRTV